MIIMCAIGHLSTLVHLIVKVNICQKHKISSEVVQMTRQILLFRPQRSCRVRAAVLLVRDHEVRSGLQSAVECTLFFSPVNTEALVGARKWGENDSSLRHFLVRGVQKSLSGQRWEGSSPSKKVTLHRHSFAASECSRSSLIQNIIASILCKTSKRHISTVWASLHLLLVKHRFKLVRFYWSPVRGSKSVSHIHSWTLHTWLFFWNGLVVCPCPFLPWVWI